MGGGKDKSEIKTIIKNELDVEITTETNNLNKIVNESITNITTNMVQTAAAKITQTTAASNTISTGSLVATGGGKVNLAQQAKVQAENKAIIQIVMSADSMAKLGNDIINDITNKVKNDQAAKQSMESLAKIGELTKDAGGVEAMVDKIAGMAQNMMKSATGGSKEESSTTEITNSIKTKLKNTTTNSSDIKNAITTNITNDMKMAAEAQCNMDTKASNVLNATEIRAEGVGSEIIVKQNANVKSFNDCFIKLEMGAKIANELTNGYKVKTESDTTTKQTTDQALKSDAKIEKETIKESAVGKSLDNLVDKGADVVKTGLNIANTWVYMIGAIILVVIIGIIYLISSVGKSFSFGSSTDTSTDTDVATSTDTDVATDVATDVDTSVDTDANTDNDQEGGENILLNSNTDGNIYLLAILVIIIITTARKSLPLCSILLIVIFLYFVYKTNPKSLSYPNKS